MSVPTTFTGRHDGCGGTVVFHPGTRRSELLAGETVVLSAVCRQCGESLSIRYSLSGDRLAALRAQDGSDAELGPVTPVDAGAPGEPALFPPADPVREGVPAAASAEGVEEADVHAPVSEPAEMLVGVGAGGSEGWLETGQWLDPASGAPAPPPTLAASQGYTGARERLPEGGAGAVAVSDGDAGSHGGNHGRRRGGTVTDLASWRDRGDELRDGQETGVEAASGTALRAPLPDPDPQVKDEYLERFAHRFAAARAAVQRVRDGIPDVLSTEVGWASPSFPSREPLADGPLVQAPAAEPAGGEAATIVPTVAAFAPVEAAAPAMPAPEVVAPPMPAPTEVAAPEAPAAPVEAYVPAEAPAAPVEAYVPAEAPAAPVEAYVPAEAPVAAFEPQPQPELEAAAWTQEVAPAPVVEAIAPTPVPAVEAVVPEHAVEAAMPAPDASFAAHFAEAGAGLAEAGPPSAPPPPTPVDPTAAVQPEWAALPGATTLPPVTDAVAPMVDPHGLVPPAPTVDPAAEVAVEARGFDWGGGAAGPDGAATTKSRGFGGLKLSLGRKPKEEPAATGTPDDQVFPNSSFSAAHDDPKQPASRTSALQVVLVLVLCLGIGFGAYQAMQAYLNRGAEPLPATAVPDPSATAPTAGQPATGTGKTGSGTSGKASGAAGKEGSSAAGNGTASASSNAAGDTGSQEGLNQVAESADKAVKASGSTEADPFAQP